MIIKGLMSSKIAEVVEKRRLAGRVSVDGAVASKRIVVEKRGTAEYIASTHSNADGTWEIRGMPVLPEKSLQATCYDDTGTYNAEVLDYLSQVE